MRAIGLGLSFAVASVAVQAQEVHRLVGAGEQIAKVAPIEGRMMAFATLGGELDRRVNLVARLTFAKGAKLEASQANEYCSPTAYRSGGGDLYPACLIDADQDGKFDTVTSDRLGANAKIKEPIPYQISQEMVIDPRAVQRILIYSGGSDRSINLSYREFTADGMARPAFTENFVIPIDKYPAVISVKSTRFTVYRVSSEGAEVSP